nr:MAG TPA: hypothetical protein [Bacteriophage sp.]
MGCITALDFVLLIFSFHFAKEARPLTSGTGLFCYMDKIFRASARR